MLILLQPAQSGSAGGHGSFPIPLLHILNNNGAF